MDANLFTPQDRKAFEHARSLHAQGKIPQAGEAYYALLQRFPDHPDLHEAMGRLAAMGNRFDHAEFHFRRCLKAAPERLKVLEDLGVITDLQGRRDEALAIFTALVEAVPGSVSAHVKRGIALSHHRRPEEALVEFEAALHLDRTDRDALNQRAEMLRCLGQDQAAFEAFRALAEAHPEDPLSRFQWGCALLEAGHWFEGWSEYEARRGATQNPAFPKPVAGRPWDGALAPGLRLLVQLEQGAGDSFQCFRFLPRLLEAGLSVTVQVPPSQASVVPLLQAQALPLRWIATTDPVPEVDAHVPLMSLVHLLQIGLEEVWGGPYLGFPASQAPAIGLARAPGAKARVGIATLGSSLHWNDHYRSMDPECLTPLLDSLPQIHWVNLNKGATSWESSSPQGAWSDPMPQVRDYLDTAGVIGQLDAVVAVDTGVAHLAGAMGVPVLLMLPRCWEWRWMRQGETSPWYPGHRLFRQEVAGDWTPVISGVSRTLAAMFPQT